MSAGSKRKYQKRGRERRQHIIRNALELLKEEDLDRLSLADIALRSQVPLSSLYHFFPDLNNLWSELIPVFYRDLLAHWKNKLTFHSGGTWPELLTATVESTVVFYRGHPEYVQLILAGKTPVYFKYKQTEKGDFAARAMQRGFRRLLNVDIVPNRRTVYENVFQIIEHFLTLSVMRHGEIKDEMVREACRAGIAYLSLYHAPYTPIAPTAVDGPGKNEGPEKTDHHE